MSNLQLVNGCLLLDNSAIEKWRCPSEFDMSVNQKRSLVAARAGRNFGSACHEAWAVRYGIRGVNFATPDCIDKMNEALRFYFEKSPEPGNDFRNLGHATRYIAEYNRVYRDEPFTILNQPLHCKNPGKPIVEEPFMLPFAIAHYKGLGGWLVLPWDEQIYQSWRLKPSREIVPIFYTGKIDLGISNNNGIFSFDHKTAYQFGESFEKEKFMDGGQRGYCWALGQIMGVKATGYIINACRVRRPSKKSEYEEGASVDPSDFQRIPKWLDQVELNEWEQDVRDIVLNILTTDSTGRYPHHRWECVRKFGPCDFYEICSSQLAQRQWQLHESSLYEANTWSPLKPANEES